MAITRRSAAPEISVVIVAWNGRALLEECLRRLFAQVPEPAFEVIVVDNASQDGAPGMVEARFPDVRLIRAGANLGFAAGNNLGFSHARGDIVLMLNPDAFLIGTDTISRLARFLRSHPDHAGVGCKLLYADGRHQVGDAGHAPTPGSMIVHGFGLSRLLPGMRGVFLTRIPPTGMVEVDWISGALFMVRKEVIARVGGLDAGFFLYAEDVEWGCRIRDAGWRIAYLPEVSAIHVQGGTQDGPADAARAPSTRWIDAFAELYRRRNPGRFYAFRFGLGLGFAARAVMFALLSIFPGRRPALNRARTMSIFARHILSMPGN